MSDNFLRLALGASLGVFAYRFYQTERGKKMKKAIAEGVAKLAGRTENLAETVKDKAMKAV